MYLIYRWYIVSIHISDSNMIEWGYNDYFLFGPCGFCHHLASVVGNGGNVVCCLQTSSPQLHVLMNLISLWYIWNSRLRQSYRTTPCYCHWKVKNYVFLLKKYTCSLKTLTDKMKLSADEMTLAIKPTMVSSGSETVYSYCSLNGENDVLQLFVYIMKTSIEILYDTKVYIWLKS